MKRRLLICFFVITHSTFRYDYSLINWSYMIGIVFKDHRLRLHTTMHIHWTAFVIMEAIIGIMQSYKYTYIYNWNVCRPHVMHIYRFVKFVIVLFVNFCQATSGFVMTFICTVFCAYQYKYRFFSLDECHVNRIHSPLSIWSSVCRYGVSHFFVYLIET